jgi:hypothetical protein
MCKDWLINSKYGVAAQNARAHQDGLLHHGLQAIPAIGKASSRTGGFPAVGEHYAIVVEHRNNRRAMLTPD